MQRIKVSVRQAAGTWILILLLFVAAVFFIASKSRTAGLDILVPGHLKSLDIFFTWFTYLGDGIFILAVVVILLIKKRTFLGLNILFSYAISGLLVQVFKNIFPSPRPAVLFREAGRAIYEIPDVTLMHSNASFPSGHTASVFALVATLLLLFPKNKWNALLLFVALAVAYSRMYLGNHFFVDISAGALIGILSAFGSLLIANRIFSGKKIAESW